MSRFTYEESNSGNQLETYEWDNLWWEHTEKVGVPRMLYVGDSISCGILPKLNFCAQGQILFDGLGTSKALDNPFLVQTMRLFAAQRGSYEVVLFNNGLHGWHLEDETEYRRYYERTITAMKDIFSEARIVILTTTGAADEERNARVVCRNKIAEMVAAERGITFIDLYTLSEQYLNLKADDGIHFKDQGYQMLAEYILRNIKGLSAIKG